MLMHEMPVSRERSSNFSNMPGDIDFAAAHEQQHGAATAAAITAAASGSGGEERRPQFSQLRLPDRRRAASAPTEKNPTMNSTSGSGSGALPPNPQPRRRRHRRPAGPEHLASYQPPVARVSRRGSDITDATGQTERTERVDNTLSGRVAKGVLNELESELLDEDDEDEDEDEEEDDDLEKVAPAPIPPPAVAVIQIGDGPRDFDACLTGTAIPERSPLDDPAAAGGDRTRRRADLSSRSGMSSISGLSELSTDSGFLSLETVDRSAQPPPPTPPPQQRRTSRPSTAMARTPAGRRSTDPEKSLSIEGNSKGLPSANLSSRTNPLSDDRNAAMDRSALSLPTARPRGDANRRTPAGRQLTIPESSPVSAASGHGRPPADMSSRSGLLSDAGGGGSKNSAMDRSAFSLPAQPRGGGSRPSAARAGGGRRSSTPDKRSSPVVVEGTGRPSSLPAAPSPPLAPTRRSTIHVPEWKAPTEQYDAHDPSTSTRSRRHRASMPCASASIRESLCQAVPFVQIYEERHKHQIRRDSLKSHTIRVFYSSAQARDDAAEVLKDVGEMMAFLVKDAKKVLSNPKSKPDEEAMVLENLQWDGVDVTVRKIDQNAPDCYGVEIAERLFWEAYVMTQDCDRPPGSEFDTGHASSEPDLQDKNLRALRHIPGEGSEDDDVRPVVRQMDPDSPMGPQTLVIAYEKDGVVRPASSEFYYRYY